MRRIIPTVALTALAVALFAGDAVAKTMTHRDEIRGFTCEIADSFEQTPPQPGTANLHVAAEWLDSSPKFGRFSGDQPTFRLIWTVTPKPGKAAPGGDEPTEPTNDVDARWRAALAASTRTFDGDVNSVLETLDHLFGPYRPLDEHVAAQAVPRHLTTASGQRLRVVEVNAHDTRPTDTAATWWLWAAFGEFETETGTVRLGFYGYVDVKFAKALRKQFERTVTSFELLPAAAALDPETAPPEPVSSDPEVEAKLSRFVREKVIKGWAWRRTEHYLLVYDEDVDARIIQRLTGELEAFRAQVLERDFPLAEPSHDVTIVRVCESRKQYMAYGAPGGSTGYWSPYHEEAVLYQDRNDMKGVFAVARSIACQGYLDQALGGIRKHAWFGSGLGDLYAGYTFRAQRYEIQRFVWRTKSAAEAAERWAAGLERTKNAAEGALPERLHLAEWLTWSRAQYDGRNDWQVPGGTNFALGWSFVYFLRTTTNETYGKILTRYYTTLRDLVAAGEHEDGDTDWRSKALAAALDGVDLTQLEADWLAATRPAEPADPDDPR